MNVNPDSPVILVTSGSAGITYVRWYPDVWSAERNHVMMTVTTHGISIHTKYLEDIPRGWIDKAREVRQTLQADPHADLKMVATHRNSVVSNGPLVPVNGNG